jgi:hypothetical protein
MRNTGVAQVERSGHGLSGNAWTLVSSLTALFYFCWVSWAIFGAQSLVGLNHGSLIFVSWFSVCWLNS